ncbi:bifunctional proline dehydrogenase/L-glutamate gamma-semialdehyde dehydrogenase PutA [Notoacmeibacter sp. MSK16QG-6]|uniref:bifunctional proline dehydrogenase/L-glutamate gamma-semialdehyde dehydrogenase PutA n=1 Tax=Notoacmeibacter sp. MSK16QG-6 TaxID=2957982 RepID=UPI00209E29B7|nr:bifunctional proline dehydrogenase/L-glutamate gamma-semialdehyde dehydrogenase PutA [Notoacmeibacter sp. MSK16QG-6]MCP1200742.1 bifunctional proline dehydrogenase/L-glutamate gamma-semialdehyde dehydrogenase PutA [Notoacmeibacter sp. MSK16QG-6]
MAKKTVHLSDIEAMKFAPETALIEDLCAYVDLAGTDREAIRSHATELVSKIRKDGRPGLMEIFLAEYGLSTDEGIALMCLAEALLRVPDVQTIEDLIEDKIAPSDWGRHLGKSASSLVNASTWALLITGRVLEDRGPGIASHLRGAVKRLGEPVIRTAVARAMKEMGHQFVLGETIEKALDRARIAEEKGYTYSYDMLGEAAMTDEDAQSYRRSYERAIDAIAKRCVHKDFRRNPGISIKLSALHPRYEVAHSDRVMVELVPVVTALARKAASANMNLNIDAEEADRLELSLKVIEAVLADQALAGWDGFGVVVQAYGRRAGITIDWLHQLVEALDRKITVRLVKGAYWDTEVKRAQVAGLEDFPVFTRKASTDVSYLANSQKLLRMRGRIYPQFATHNAHTIAAILRMTQNIEKDSFEFQRLHGMGDRLHHIVKQEDKTRCRVYAPVGAYRDLLAYLVRRLLENGANSSFVNQIVDERIAPEDVASCPFEELKEAGSIPNPHIRRGPELFLPERANSAGFDINTQMGLDGIDDARGTRDIADAEPIIAGDTRSVRMADRRNPATGEVIGSVTEASLEDVETALAAARPWQASVDERAAILKRASELYERDFGTIFAILQREAGKTVLDAIGELREAVDFLLYYAARAGEVGHPARGRFVCISPWNFPLAIFTGQIAAALATGNGVLAKPAEQTPLIAAHAVRLLHEAGVPRHALQLLPGEGALIGAALTSDSRVDGVAFTGSTETALAIRKAMADHLAPGAPLIAETGGLNAMIVDSTALPEQAVRDIVASAFQSAGQRCSALRCLYLQEDIGENLLEMLKGAMDELVIGDPWSFATDIGPLIDKAARDEIQAYVDKAGKDGRLIKQCPASAEGAFVGPALIRIGGIAEMQREIFGPVLHVCTYAADEIDDVVDAINATGYGLTFGLHTRIDGRVQAVTDRIEVGNAYVNRNQIGAIVGSQPFGGEGLSGTGPKAGGPNYLARFTKINAPLTTDSWEAAMEKDRLDAAIMNQGHRTLIGVVDLPGPTGESNRLSYVTRPPILCLGPGRRAVDEQAQAISALGGLSVRVDGDVEPSVLTKIDGISGAVWWGGEQHGRLYARALAKRSGPIVPLISEMPDFGHVTYERHLCIDTTAAGGNAQLLAETEGI